MKTDLIVTRRFPFAYTKETIDKDFWWFKDGEAVDVSFQGIKKHELVYLDRKRVVDDKPHEEYIHRMNMGIKDAVDGAGVPPTYVQMVIGPFIPEQRTKEVSELAGKISSKIKCMCATVEKQVDSPWNNILSKSG